MTSQANVLLENLQANRLAWSRFYEDYKSATTTMYKDNNIDSKALAELGRSANSLARLSPYCEELSNFPDQLVDLIKWCVSCSLQSCHVPPPLYLLCKAFVILNDIEVKEFDTFSLELFMSFQTAKDESFKKYARAHIIHSIRSQKEAGRTRNHNKLKDILCILLQDDSEGVGSQGVGSLIILCTLYRDEIWADEITANAICDACLHKSPNIRQAAGIRLLAFDEMSNEPNLALLSEDMFERKDTRTSSSPLALIDKKIFGEKLRSSLEVGQHFEVMPCKLYIRTLGANSILKLFDDYLQKYTTSNLEDVTELLLTSFRDGLDNVIDQERLESFMEIQSLANRELMDLVRNHIIDCIHYQKDKKAQKKLKKTLLRMLKVNQADAKAEGSLVVLCSLYKTKFWWDTEIANAICNACLIGSSKVKRAASLFLLGFKIKDKETDHGMPNEIDLQLEASSSPLALIEKKDFGEKLKSHLQSCQRSEVLMLCKLYVWTIGPDSILELFTPYLKRLIKNELEEVIEFFLTSFRAGLDKVIDQERLESFMEIQSLANMELMDLVINHVIDCIRYQKDKKAQKKLKETLLRMLKVNQVDAKAEGSLVVLCSLYKTKFWLDTEIADVICNACLNGSSKIAKVALSFILEIDIEGSSKILRQMSKKNLLTRLKDSNQPEENLILFKVFALMVETPVISEVDIRDAYVKLRFNQEEVAELFAGALQDYHIKNPFEAQNLFKETVLWFFEDASGHLATKRSKAAGLLFIRKVCNAERQLIYEDLKNNILSVKKYYEAIRKKTKDDVKITESAQELIDLIEQLGSMMTQSSKRKRDPKNKQTAKKRTG